MSLLLVVLVIFLLLGGSGYRLGYAGGRGFGGGPGLSVLAFVVLGSFYDG